MNDQEEFDPAAHRALRELLGTYVLGGLNAAEETALRAHLDGCAACRAERDELAPLADALLLIDPERVDSPASPPPGLGDRITSAVAAERVLRDRRQRAGSRIRRAAVAAAVLVAFGAGAGAASVVNGRDTSETAQPAPGSAGQGEPIVLRVMQPGIGVTSAALVPHTWGVEVMVVLTGLGPGEKYRAVIVSRGGGRSPAGEFLGVAGRPVVCDLQAALLRQDASGFLLIDTRGRTVAQADLRA